MPASAVAPMSSPGTPMARSATPPPNWPAARAAPRPSPVSAVPGAPPPLWWNSWLPAATKPESSPYSTVTAPAPVLVPTVSPGAPTARSWLVVPPKSAAPRAVPKRSPVSGRPWVMTSRPTPLKPGA
jgi:hypothetical protein